MIAIKHKQRPNHPPLWGSCGPHACSSKLHTIVLLTTYTCSSRLLAILA